MATIDDVNDVVAAFLVAATDALELTDAGPPGRIYTSPSRPALDCCGQLTCWASLLAEAPTASGAGGLADLKRARIGAVPEITIIIQATRCAPTQENDGGRIKLPAAADLAAASRMTGQDVWAIYTHLKQQLRPDGTLSQVCKGAAFDGAVAIAEQGGCVGWEFTYRYPTDAGVIGT